jgi:hypothetical protein
LCGAGNGRTVERMRFVALLALVGVSCTAAVAAPPPVDDDVKEVARLCSEHVSNLNAEIAALKAKLASCNKR